MNLTTALNQAARVAVAEGAKYEQAMSLDRRDSWSVISKDGKLTYFNGTSAQCDEWLAARVNAAVFSWLERNWFKIAEDVSGGPMTILKALASGGGFVTERDVIADLRQLDHIADAGKMVSIDALTSKWQPIETAPNDRFVDLWVVREGTRGWDKTPFREEYRIPNACLEKDGWNYDHDNREGPFVVKSDYNHTTETATHWMPIPNAPDVA